MPFLSRHTHLYWIIDALPAHCLSAHADICGAAQGARAVAAPPRCRVGGWQSGNGVSLRMLEHDTRETIAQAACVAHVLRRAVFHRQLLQHRVLAKFVWLHRVALRAGK